MKTNLLAIYCDVCEEQVSELQPAKYHRNTMLCAACLENEPDGDDLEFDDRRLSIWGCM